MFNTNHKRMNNNSRSDSYIKFGYCAVNLNFYHKYNIIIIIYYFNKVISTFQGISII